MTMDTYCKRYTRRRELSDPRTQGQRSEVKQRLLRWVPYYLLVVLPVGISSITETVFLLHLVFEQLQLPLHSRGASVTLSLGPMATDLKVLKQ